MRISPHFSGNANGLRDYKAISKSQPASTELLTRQASGIFAVTDIRTDTAQISSYPQEHLSWMRAQLNRCQYGWAWDWTKPLARVPIQQFSDGLQLDHKIPKAKPGQTLSGDCLSLSEQLGNQLAARFQGEYRFYVADGNFTHSPWESHFFIVGWPVKQDKQNRQHIGESLGEIPKNSLIIDPSYGLMGIKGQGATDDPLNRYSVETSLQDIAKLTPLPVSDRLRGNSQTSRQKSTVKHHLLLYKPASREKGQKSPCTSGLPLGYMCKLAPQSAAKYGGSPAESNNALAILYFEKRGERKPPKVIVSVIDATDGEKPARVYRDWRREFPRFSPLHTSLSNLERTLALNPMNLFSSLKSRFSLKPPDHNSGKMLAIPWKELEHELRNKSEPNSISPNQDLDQLEPASVRLRQILRRADGPAGPE